MMISLKMCIWNDLIYCLREESSMQSQENHLYNKTKPRWMQTDHSIFIQKTPNDIVVLQV